MGCPEQGHMGWHTRRTLQLPLTKNIYQHLPLTNHLEPPFLKWWLADWSGGTDPTRNLHVFQHCKSRLSYLGMLISRRRTVALQGEQAQGEKTSRGEEVQRKTTPGTPVWGSPLLNEQQWQQWCSAGSVAGQGHRFTCQWQAVGHGFTSLSMAGRV